VADVIHPGALNERNQPVIFGIAQCDCSIVTMQAELGRIPGANGVIVNCHQGS